MPIAEPPGFYATVGAVLTPAVEQRYSTTTANGTTINTTSDVGAGLGSEAGIGYDFGKARAEITAIYNPRSINSTTLDYLGNKRTFLLSGSEFREAPCTVRRHCRMQGRKPWCCGAQS